MCFLLLQPLYCVTGRERERGREREGERGRGGEVCKHLNTAIMQVKVLSVLCHGCLHCSLVLTRFRRTTKDAEPDVDVNPDTRTQPFRQHLVACSSVCLVVGCPVFVWVGNRTASDWNQHVLKGCTQAQVSKGRCSSGGNVSTKLMCRLQAH